MFCQKCGTQNPDDGMFCSKCGNDLKSTIQAERKGISSKLGKMGVPGFRSGKTWKMAIAIFGYFFIFIFLLALISPTPAPKTSPSMDSPLSITPVATVQKTLASLPTPTPIETIQPNDDKEFNRVTTESGLIFTTDHQGISDAIQKDDYISEERYGTQLESDATKYLSIIDELHVSPKYKNIYDEYLARLDDAKKAGENYKKAAQFLQLNDVENGIKYMKLGNDYTNQESEHLKRIVAYYKAMTS